MGAAPFEQVKAFHRVFDPAEAKGPTALDAVAANQRAGFKIEELVEFLYAAAQDQTEFERSITALKQTVDRAATKVQSKQRAYRTAVVGEADALVDLLYFTYGSFVLMDVDPAPLFRLVHAANMGKLFPDGRPHYDPVTGQVLTPANWQADFAQETKIAAEIARQGQQEDS